MPVEIGATGIRVLEWRSSRHRLLQIYGRVLPSRVMQVAGYLEHLLGIDKKEDSILRSISSDFRQHAAEIDAAPTLTTLLASPRALIAYAFGQAYISFFRLQGPFRSAHAWRTAETELFEPVLSRGVAANAIFVATMLLFAWMNLIAHAVEWTLWLVAPKFVERKRREAYHDLP